MNWVTSRSRIMSSCHDDRIPPRQGFFLLIYRGYVHRLWFRFGRQDLVCVYSDDIIQDQVHDDPFHDRDSQYTSSDVFYHTPFYRQVSKLPTNHHSHFFLFQLLSRGNEYLLSRSHTNSPFQKFSRLIRWGYVHRLLIQGYFPGWI